MCCNLRIDSKAHNIQTNTVLDKQKQIQHKQYFKSPIQLQPGN